MLTLDAVLYGLALPAGVAGVLLLLGRVPLVGHAAAALSVGGAYLAAHVGLRGWRGWVPRESTDRVGAIVAAGTVLALLGLSRRGPAPLRALLGAGCGIGAAAYLAGATWHRDAGLSGAAWQAGLAGAAAALLWLGLAREAADAAPRDARGGAAESALLAVAAGGAAVAVCLSGSQLLAQLMGAFAAALAGAAAAGRLLGARPPLPVVAPALALGHVALLLAATTYATLPREAAGLLALAPLAAPGTARGAARGGVVVRLAAVVLLAGGGAWLAWDASPSFEGL